jgi:septum formation protein
VDTERLILASRSPQRIRLLRDAGFVFEIDPADIDEAIHPSDLPPEGVAEFLAGAKAAHVAGRRPGALVLGADTVVIGADGSLLGKPRDAEHARQMLSSLSGTTHKVVTGVALHGPGIRRVAHVHTAVRMRELTAEEVAAYVAIGQWQGKAGGYGIQDDDPFVTAIEGSISNVIGLPMELVADWLRAE